MSEKIAIFEDLDDLANFTAGRSAGLISGATDKMCVSKGNFDIISSITIADEGNGLMFVEGSESYNYAPERLIQLKDVQYISEITATLVSAPNILAKGGSSYATWELTQYYKAGNASFVSKKEWSVDGTTVSSNSKGTTESAETDVEKSIATVESYGKTIMLSQMIKQDSNTAKLGIWSTPTVTVSPSSIESKGGNSSISISGNPQRINEWSSGATSVDEAEISKVSATFGTVSSDFTTLTVGVNENVSTRSGKVSVEWVYNNDVVKIVDSNEYKQQSQSSCEMTLKSSSVAYHGKAYVVGNASVDGKIWWGEDSANMNNYTEVYANIDVNIIERTSLGKTIIYAYFVPSDENIAPLGNKNQYYASAAAEITKASDASLTLSVYNRNYNGSAQMVAECGEPHGVSSWGIGYSKSGVSTITWVDNKNLSLTDAGTYDIWVKWTADNNHSNNESGKYTGQIVTINKAAGSGEITMSGWTYGGTVTSPTVTKNPNNASVSYTWYNSSKTQLSAKPESTSTAGTYYVKATFGAVTNHNAYTTDYVSFTIAKATGSISVSRKTPTYTGSAVTIATATATGDYQLGIGSSSTYAPSSWGSVNSSLTATTAGTYYVWAKCGEGTNHNAVSAYYVGTATINKATPTLKFTASSSTLTYNGSTQNIGTISYTGDGNFYYVVSTSTNVPTSGWTKVTSLRAEIIKSSAATAETYYVYLKSDAGTNYVAVSSTSYSGSKAINKKAVTVTADSASKTYDGTALTKNTATASGLVSGHKLNYYTCTGSITDYSTLGTANVPSDAKIVDANSINVTSNYNISYVNGTLKINKRNVTFKAEYESKEYTGSVLSASNTAKVTAGDGLVIGHTATVTCNGSRISVGKTTKNILTVTIMSESTDVTSNYNITKESGEFEVIQREVKITPPTAIICTYNGSDQTIFGAGTCTTGGTMYYSDTGQDFSTSTWSKDLPYTQKTNAGTYTLYYYCYVSDIGNNTGTDINKKLSISATINKAPATISFAGSNLTVQCKNSDKLLGQTRDVQYLAAIVTGGSVSYTIDSIKNPSGVTGTFISESQTTLRGLRVEMGTPVGDYSVDITASQSNPNYTSASVTRTYKISVLPDILGDYTGTLSISNSSTKLSAGDDTRTITWGAIHQVWKHGGNKVYMPNNANLTVSCNDSTAKKYVSINKNSYVNSSNTTTTTLTKTTYSSVYEHSIGATFTLELRTYDGKIIQTLDIAANPNNKIHTLKAVNLSYSVAGSTIGSTNIPSVTYDTTYGYQSGAVISTTTGNTSPTLDDNTTFTKSFEEYQSNGYASVNASTGVVTWNSSNPSSTERKMTVKCTGVLDSKGITSSKSVIAEAKQSDTSKSIRVSYVNSGCPYGCSYRVLAKSADLTTIQYGSATGNFHTETYGISELTVVAYATNQSGSSKTLTLTWSGGGGTSTMIGTGVSSASRSTLSITVPNGTYQGSNKYYIAVTLTSTGNMSGSIQFSLS